MKAKEILNKHYNVDEGFTEYEILSFVEAMKEYAREKCDMQRENCAKNILKDELRNMKMVSRVLTAISNAPEPKFD